jgi:hypothetical protein
MRASPERQKDPDTTDASQNANNERDDSSARTSSKRESNCRASSAEHNEFQFCAFPKKKASTSGGVRHERQHCSNATNEIAEDLLRRNAR